MGSLAPDVPNILESMVVATTQACGIAVEGEVRLLACEGCVKEVLGQAPESSIKNMQVTCFYQFDVCLLWRGIL